MNFFAVAIQIKTFLAQLLCVTVTIYPFLIKKKMEFLWSFTMATVGIKMVNSEQFTSSLSNFTKKKLPIECK